MPFQAFACMKSAKLQYIIFELKFPDSIGLLSIYIF